ncbi:MAG: hypothetical protein EZS28_016181 [Streblomastix strix]|uniref:Uncharacterized protein n=1 Tax=Streblomastix strix TaxID=222440 RepID=A0A5J4W0H8_9EUKA|nr:MAG: hypothetical protein EZS28_016181 [Streblomastix strix]
MKQEKEKDLEIAQKKIEEKDKEIARLQSLLAHSSKQQEQQSPYVQIVSVPTVDEQGYESYPAQPDAQYLQAIYQQHAYQQNKIPYQNQIPTISQVPVKQTIPSNTESNSEQMNSKFNPVSDSIPFTIQVPSPESTKVEGYTYTSTQCNYQTFPISPTVGVMKSGLVVPIYNYPGIEPYAKDCAAFNCRGIVEQNEEEESGNKKLKEGDIITIEVNLLETPRTAHLFINGQQQPVFVSGLPESIQFWFFLNYGGGSVTVLSLKKLNVPTVTKIPDEKEMKWT